MMKRDPKGTYSYQGQLYGAEYAKEGRSVAALDKLAPLTDRQIRSMEEEKARKLRERAVTGKVTDRGLTEEADEEDAEDLEQFPEEVIDGGEGPGQNEDLEEQDEEVEEEPLAAPTKPKAKGKKRGGRR